MTNQEDNEQMKFGYTESQGAERDNVILERYALIIDYFANNLERVSLKNLSILVNLYQEDRVLRKNGKLMSKLCRKILNSDYVNEMLSSSPSVSIYDERSDSKETPKMKIKEYFSKIHESCRILGTSSQKENSLEEEVRG